MDLTSTMIDIYIAPEGERGEIEMCINCWNEYGSPKLVNQRVITTANLISDVYEIHPAGGHCHIVTDDWNLEDSSVDFCITDARIGGHYSEPETEVCVKALAALRELSIDERASALAIFDGFFTARTGETQ